MAVAKEVIRICTSVFTKHIIPESVGWVWVLALAFFTGSNGASMADGSGLLDKALLSGTVDAKLHVHTKLSANV